MCLTWLCALAWAAFSSTDFATKIIWLYVFLAFPMAVALILLMVAIILFRQQQTQIAVTSFNGGVKPDTIKVGCTKKKIRDSEEFSRRNF